MPLPTLPRAQRLVAGVACVAFLGLAGTALRHHRSGTLTADRAALQILRGDLSTALRQARVADAEASDAAAMALALDGKRAEAEARAARAEASALHYREAFARARLDAPDTCAVVVAAADSALTAADSTTAGLRTALQRSKDAETALGAGLDTTRAALAALRIASVRVDSAAKVVAHDSRPSLLARVLPRIGVGGAAGMAEDGRPHLVTGVTLGWSF